MSILQEYKLIVAGSRNFQNYPLLKVKLDLFLKGRLPFVEIVSGHAQGADQLGEKYAQERGLVLKTFPAEWAKWGRGAGLLRNGEMAAYADALIAFWDGKSRGTADMIKKMRQAGKPFKVVEV